TRERIRQGGARARRRGSQRRPGVAVPAPSALSPLHRFGVRRHEERIHAAPGIASARRGVPARVRRRRRVGAPRHVGPGIPRALARRLHARARRHRLGRAADCRARRLARMNFDLTEEHELLRSTVREFAESRVAPVAAELDRESRFPYELVAEMAGLGLMGIPIAEEHGGAGADTVAYAIAIEELTRIDSSVAITVAAHTSLGTMPILLFGNDEQKRDWLPQLAAGQRLAAFGLTEPGAGSDAGAT